MSEAKKTYPAEFKRRMVEPVRAGRSPESLAREFEPSPNTIRKWATQADVDEGLRAEGLTTAERRKLRELRRKIKQLELSLELPLLPIGGSMEDLGSSLEELLLPGVELAGLDAVAVTQVRDGHVVQEVLPEDADLLLGGKVGPASAVLAHGCLLGFWGSELPGGQEFRSG
jgi:transposase